MFLYMFTHLLVLILIFSDFQCIIVTSFFDISIRINPPMQNQLQVLNCSREGELSTFLAELQLTNIFLPIQSNSQVTHMIIPDGHLTIEQHVMSLLLQQLQQQLQQLLLNTVSIKLVSSQFGSLFQLDFHDEQEEVLLLQQITTDDFLNYLKILLVIQISFFYSLRS